MAFIPRRAIQLLLLGLVAAHAAVPPCEHAPDCKAASTCEQYGGPNTESQPIFDTICLNNVKWAEPSFSGKYDKFWDSGVYKCSCCGQELYSSEHKYDSRSGWPAYYDTISPSAVLLNPEDGELVCSRCGLHLGHRFTDGPQDKTGLRDCINSACMTFEPDQSIAAPAVELLSTATGGSTGNPSGSPTGGSTGSPSGSPTGGSTEQPNSGSASIFSTSGAAATVFILASALFHIL